MKYFCFTITKSSGMASRLPLFWRGEGFKSQSLFPPGKCHLSKKAHRWRRHGAETPTIPSQGSLEEDQKTAISFSGRITDPERGCRQLHRKCRPLSWLQSDSSCGEFSVGSSVWAFPHTSTLRSSVDVNSQVPLQQSDG